MSTATNNKESAERSPDCADNQVAEALVPGLVQELAKIKEILSRCSQIERDNLESTLAKYRDGKATQWEEKKLIGKGLIVAPVLGGLGNLPSECGSLADLCALLNRHFSGKISLDISRQIVNRWRKGELLPNGAPPPPLPSGGKHLVKQTAEWIERWILPTHSVGAADSSESHSIFEEANRAKAQREIDEAAIARINRKVAEGANQPVEVYIANIRFAGTVVNSAITSQVERAICDKVTAVVNLWDIPQEKKTAMIQEIQSASQSAADTIRAGMQAALREAAEKIT